MQTYIVRPYFGHDCNSWDGFNNGHYLDDITVSADSPEDAIEQAMKQFIHDPIASEIIDKPKAEIDGHFGESTIYWEYCYTDGEGNEITEAEFQDLNEDAEVGGYLYQYIDFNNVEEINTNE